MYNADDKDPLPTRAIVVRELPNLRHALDLMLASAATPPSPDLSGEGGRGDEGGLDAASELSTCIARFLYVFGRWSERDAMQAQVERALAATCPPSSVSLSRAELVTLVQREQRLLQSGRATEAEGICCELLSKMGDTPSYERATILVDLGRSLGDQGKPLLAAKTYRETLAVPAQLDQSPDVKQKTGTAHTDLADVLRDAGQYGEARKEYEASLAIKKEIGGEERGIAVVLGQMGTLALKQNDLTEARRRHTEALAAFRNMGEQQMEAVAWHQLGAVAQEAKDWAEAERCYKESLALDERFGDTAGAAQTCNQLALVAKGAGRPDEAERWYKRAIEVFVELRDPQAQAKVLNNLANLLLANLHLAPGRLDEAERYAHRAREIDETLDLSSQPWTTYSILAQIAERRGRAEEARQWRRKEQETFTAFAGADVQIQQYLPLINRVAQAAQGDTNARKWIEGEYPKMQAGGENWTRTAASIQRMIAGECDVDSLTQNLDRVGGLIVRRILGLLQEPPPEPSPVPQKARDRGGSDDSLPPPSGGRAGDGGEGITLQDILALVVAGCKGDARAGGQAYQIAQALQQPEQPPEIRQLGRGLQRVLEGLRGEEAVQGLPEEAAEVVRAVLKSVTR